jgi:hypothetical protein
MQRLEVSGAVRPMYGSLGVKWLMCAKYVVYVQLLGFITVTVFGEEYKC